MAGKQKRVLHFSRLQNTQGVKFFIASHNKEKKAISFSVKENEQAEWKLFPGAARWLYTIESQLSDAIVETRL